MNAWWVITRNVELSLHPCCLCYLLYLFLFPWCARMSWCPRIRLPSEERERERNWIDIAQLEPFLVSRSSSALSNCTLPSPSLSNWTNEISAHQFFFFLEYLLFLVFPLLPSFLPSYDLPPLLVPTSIVSSFCLSLLALSPTQPIGGLDDIKHLHSSA